jgi:tRNA threonylcarbamoyl adenosine modification protein (Sua5/YciO/YrdC/YwlC family)
MIYILPTDTCYGLACPLEDKKSYEKLYKIKKRRFEKPLAIMVKDFAWLQENTELTDEQIDFLRNYERPFTVITDSTPVDLFLKFGDESEYHFINKDVYDRVAFRVATNDMEESLINSVGPIWLTSANLSGAGETYDLETIEKDFAYYIEKWVAEVMGDLNLDSDIPASDIIEFDGESLDIRFLRKG